MKGCLTPCAGTEGGFVGVLEGPRNFRDDEIVSSALANVASKVWAFTSLISQSKTNATAQSLSLLLASSSYFRTH